jgi:hypothetical protein
LKSVEVCWSLWSLWSPEVRCFPLIIVIFKHTDFHWQHFSFSFCQNKQTFPFDSIPHFVFTHDHHLLNTFSLQFIKDFFQLLIYTIS